MGSDFYKRNKDETVHDGHRWPKKHYHIIVGIVEMLQATVDILDIILNGINNQRKE